MERRPRKFAVGLFAIHPHRDIRHSVPIDEMTTRHRLATERRLESRSAAARAEQFALRTASQLAVRRRRVRLAGAAPSAGGVIGAFSARRAVAHGAGVHTRIRIRWT
jgi:hypothetical protein